MPQLDVRKQFHFGWGELGFMISVEDRGVRGHRGGKSEAGRGRRKKPAGEGGIVISRKGHTVYSGNHQKVRMAGVIELTCY